MAEALLKSLGAGRYSAASAGSHPAGSVHPAAIRLLQKERLFTNELRSKSWDEFSGPLAQPVDIVITVCDNAAGESCPVWNGAPLTAHWGTPDPAAVSGPDSVVDAAFEKAYLRLRRRVDALLSVEIDGLSRQELRAAISQIAERA